MIEIDPINLILVCAEIDPHIVGAIECREVFHDSIEIPGPS